MILIMVLFAKIQNRLFSYTLLISAGFISSAIDEKTNSKNTLAGIEKIAKKYDPDYPFNILSSMKF